MHEPSTVSRYQQIVTLCNKGLSNEEIAQKTGYNLHYIQQARYRAYGPRKPTPRLTEDEKREILARWSEGEPYSVIAEEMGRNLLTIESFFKKYREHGEAAITQNIATRKQSQKITLQEAVTRAKEIANELGLVLEVSVHFKNEPEPPSTNLDTPDL